MKATPRATSLRPTDPRTTRRSARTTPPRPPTALRATAPRITRRLIAQFTAERIATQMAEDRLAVLTQREREVLALVGQGLSNEEIGAQLFLSPATARTHVSHAMVKLGARDRAQLVVVAYQTGLVSRRP